MGERLNTFSNAVLGDVEIAAKRTQAEADALGFGNGYKSPVFPQYSTGARARIKVNGNIIGAALDMSYSVSANITEVRTIDQFLPWELVPGQLTIKASLRRIVHPDRTLGGDALFSTIQAYLHQPYASLEVRDALGNVQFYAKGMFTDIQSNIQAGQITVEGVSFIGYYWRENVAQEYTPEPESAADKLKKRFSQNSLWRKVTNPLG